MAARLVQRFPEVVAPLRDGRLCITSVVALSKVLTPENRAEVLPRFFHASKAEANEIAAELAPDLAPPRREVTTPLAPCAPVAAPPEPRHEVDARAIAAAVKRALWQRDEGRCQWKLDQGGLCGATARLEVDHVHPHALGGASTIENTRLLCRFHNQLAARKAYGDAWMDRFCGSGAPGGG